MTPTQGKALAVEIKDCDRTTADASMEREKFEAWAILPNGGGYKPELVQRRGDGYVLSLLDIRWKTWQARAAISETNASTEREARTVAAEFVQRAKDATAMRVRDEYEKAYGAMENTLREPGILYEMFWVVWGRAWNVAYDTAFADAMQAQKDIEGAALSMCPACKGSGEGREDDVTGMTACVMCNGSGEVSDTAGDFAPQEAAEPTREDACPWCLGANKLASGEECPWLHRRPHPPRTEAAAVAPDAKIIGYVTAETLATLRQDSFPPRNEHFMLWHTDSPPSRAIFPLYDAPPSTDVLVKAIVDEVTRGGDHSTAFALRLAAIVRRHLPPHPAAPSNVREQALLKQAEDAFNRIGMLAAGDADAEESCRDIAIIARANVEAIRALKSDAGKGEGLDAARLDWLDKQCKPVVEGGGSQFEPYGEHVGNSWSIDGPFGDVRSAIDAALATKPGDGESRG